ncbi:MULTISPECIES: ABC transporter ATP-binding protein [unclassified Paenibacillus]|uniref:ABC transporter ATP-binding protein n=1 Tax=unclassified Paenibacillus TaxID=185978 RepID=UPI001AE2689B|nr:MULTISPECIES: ABC transporter ATP-binding protein [unclassified Paenibacillus]MBP1155021.1 ATP-binding cassette subfamily B protein [Paenibacillus sp. PvP091]MBP1169596.1 ATP-binding cassette subfamily B protein [Paenibacillus sp. PvR098]MBP2440624.1 ATP-binding cassette subfamily B protein [Paenibacillus sp. PvP052]
MNKVIRKIPAREYASLLQHYLRPQRKSMAILAVLLLSGIAMQLINPQIIRYFIDTAQEQESSRPLVLAAGLFIGVTLVQQLMAVGASYIGANVGWIATNQLRETVAAHCLKLDMSFHKSQTSGALIERVDGDINNLSNFFSNFVIMLVSNLLLVAGMLVLLFREGWLIGMGMLFFVIFAIASIQYIRKFAVPHWGKLRQVNATFYGFLGEHLEGTEDTRASGATGYVMYRFHSLLREWLPIRIRAYLGWASMWITTLLVFAIGSAVAFAISFYLWRQGSITIGTVYMIFYYTELMAKPIEQIRTQMEDLQKADASIVRIRELLQTQSLIQDGKGAAIPEGPLSVEFDGVEFGYDPESATLEHVSFRLERGQVLGLLGRTGSGKTTLARLLLRFYDPGQGRIELEGIDIREARLHELRSRVGMVTQNIEIFQGTVRDNLTFYDESVDDRRVEEVLRELGLVHWLRTLPRGLDSMLESGGGGLSAGEAQLLSFARVFLRDPGLVILDEASSRLDPATEQRIEQAMNRLLLGRTCIIIAHRLATIQRADQILVLDNGHIAEQGNRERLAADPHSHYSRMLQVGMEELLV